MSSIPLSDLEGGAPAAKFDKLGDKHVGKITAMANRPQTDPATGKVKTWDDGNPMMQWVITLEKDNGETVSLYAKGGKGDNFTPAEGSGESMLNAIGTAVRAAEASGVDVGAQLAVAHTGLGRKVQGRNQAKLFTAQYVPPAPATSIPADLFSDEEPF